MASILKIVSTPVKWVSKQILNKTILSFPGGEENPTLACVYCPEMCRFSCPTAVVSGDDTVTPCNKMGLLYKETQWPGRASGGAELWPLYDCTGCGRCTEYCKYEMPVMDRLFEARAKYSWSKAKALAEKLTVPTDPCGDLAEELGDPEAANRSIELLRKKGSPIAVIEPRSEYFLKKKGVQVASVWDKLLDRLPDPSKLEVLRGKRWLIHESVWLSRHLKKSEAVFEWSQKLKALGVQIQLPQAHGRDSIDCGGEGAFHLLFADQARKMALDIWDMDHSRADGVLCFSQRCTEHLKRNLNVPVLCIAQLYELQQGV